MLKLEIRGDEFYEIRLTVKLDSIFLFCKRNVVESCLPSWNFITRIYLRIHLHRPGGINYSKKNYFLSFQVPGYLKKSLKEL